MTQTIRYCLVMTIAVLIYSCTAMAVDNAPASSLPTAIPVTGNPDHEAMLSSADPQLAANKRLVYDMWRTLIDAHDVRAAKKYFAADYIQHNPIADTGRAGVLAYFASLGDALPVKARVQADIVAMVAEKDLVALVQVNKQSQPRPYTSTWFDLFRVKNGVIVEHWDHGTLPAGMTPRHYVPVTVNPDYQASLASTDNKLASNKQRVYDMWRILLDAQQVEVAPKYLAEDYIQHNPMADTGLNGFMDFFRQFAQPTTVKPELAHFVDMIAEHDLVVLATIATLKDSNGKPYTTTWFDMFRVKNGMMVEHWDTATLPQ